MNIFAKGMLALIALLASGFAWFCWFLAPTIILDYKPDHFDRAMAMFMRFIGLITIAFAVFLWYLVFAL